MNKQKKMKNQKSDFTCFILCAKWCGVLAKANHFYPEAWFQFLTTLCQKFAILRIRYNVSD